MTKKQVLLVPAGEDKPQLIQLDDDWRAMANAIGCDYVERVRTPIENLVIYCDEEFLLKSPRPEPNRVGFVLYPGPIHGNVLLCKERWDGEIVDLTQSMADHLLKLLDRANYHPFIGEEER